MAAFDVKMAQKRIRRDAGGVKEPPPIQQNRWHLSLEGHIHPEFHVPHHVTLTDMKVMK